MEKHPIQNSGDLEFEYHLKLGVFSEFSDAWFPFLSKLKYWEEIPWRLKKSRSYAIYALVVQSKLRSLFYQTKDGCQDKPHANF